MPEQDQKELVIWTQYKAECDTALIFESADEAEVWFFWDMLRNQRVSGFEVGEISVLAIHYVMDLYEVDSSRRQRLFERLMQIDRIYLEFVREENTREEGVKVPPIEQVRERH